MVAPARVTWLGHATVLIELDGVRLLTDPVLRGGLAHLRRHGDSPPAPERLDAVLVSHLHHDHLDLPSLRALRPDRLVVPRGAAVLAGRAGAAPVEELAPGERAAIGGVEVEATRAEHDDRRHPGGPRATPLGFVLRGGRSVYFAGDTDVFEDMREIGPVDLALLPVAGWGPTLGPGHMDARRAAQAAALIRPRRAIPIHWGTLYPRGRRRGRWFREPPHRFAALAGELAPDVDVSVLEPGQSVEL